MERWLAIDDASLLILSMCDVSLTYVVCLFHPSADSSLAPSESARVFLGNLSFKITDDDLHGVFDPCGTIQGMCGDMHVGWGWRGVNGGRMHMYMWHMLPRYSLGDR